MSLTTPYREQFLEADGITTTFPFDDHGDGFDAISKNYVKCEIYNADGSVVVPDFTVDLSAKTITITSLTTPYGQVLNAPQKGAIVRIYRDVPESQNTTAQALQSSTAQQIVQNFDNIVAMVQELQYANEHFTLRSTLPQRDLQIDLLRDIDDQKLVYWDNEKRKLVVTNYRQDELLLPADKEIILEQANAYSDEQNAVLESKINGKLTVINADIDANADAIQKTRDDYIEADSEIHQILNNHASELTTLRGNQASLGDQVSGIEEKIPGSASATNPLITKQQLLDEEMDIRDDLNESVSELQTQITAQAAEIATKQDQLRAGDNIIISNNVISATGAGGGAGFDIVVVDQLPATGQKGVIYLLAKDGTAPDVYDEYVWIERTQTFELIGTTQVDLTDYAKKKELDNYLPLSGGTLTGATNFDIGTSSYSDVPIINGGGKAIISLSTGSGGIPNGGIRVANGVVTTGTMYAAGGFGNRLDPTIAWLKTINNGADIAIPTTGGTMALAENVETAISDAIANIDALPDQSGNAGKVLTTDGSTASWQDAPAGGTKVIIKRYE